MDREQEIIHHQMEATRADLTDKLAALESKVTGTVQAATDAVETTKEAVTGTVEAVTGTVESVKDTVQETVEAVTEKVSETVGAVTEQFQETVKTVTETFNLKLQAERRPWLVFGGSVAAGALLGYLLGGRSRSPALPPPSHGDVSQAPPERQQAAGQSFLGGAAGAVGSAAANAAGTVGTALGGFLGEQLGKLKGVAIGTMMGAVRDLVARSLPEDYKDKVTQEVDRLTRNLGGEPIEGPVLPEPKSEETGHHTEEEEDDEVRTPAGYAGVGHGGRRGQSSRPSGRR